MRQAIRGQLRALASLARQGNALLAYGEPHLSQRRRVRQGKPQAGSSHHEGHEQTQGLGWRVGSSPPALLFSVFLNLCALCVSARDCLGVVLPRPSCSSWFMPLVLDVLRQHDKGRERAACLRGTPSLAKTQSAPRKAGGFSPLGSSLRSLRAQCESGYLPTQKWAKTESRIDSLMSIPWSSPAVR